jgi:hypothetical protein
VIAIDLVTHRAQPLFHTIVGGGLEHLTGANLTFESPLPRARAQMSNSKAPLESKSC